MKKHFLYVEDSEGLERTVEEGYRILHPFMILKEHCGKTSARWLDILHI